MTHTFDKGFYCKIDGNKLNDLPENRKGNCEIFDYVWKICDKCEYFGKISQTKNQNTDECKQAIMKE